MKRWIALLTALLVGTLLGLFALKLPSPAKADGAGFSALRARADIDIIARAPHSVWEQDSLEPVRQHLRERLAGLGLASTTMRYGEVTDRSGHRYPLENLSASIPGKSGSFVLLVAHYDSAPRKRNGQASCGAADDGYGVATLLEIAGLLARTKTPFENGVHFLFTDAEETGLLGARAEMTQNLAAYRDVNLVINLEARGVKGPVVMFETGPNNRATLELFQKAHRPFGYSFASDVYRRMPNGTDFSEFTRRGFAGLNFAVLDDLSSYHTPRDNPDNISLASLQHYGEQVLPMVQAYTVEAHYGGAQAFVSTENMVFLSWLPGFFLAWPVGWDRLFCGFLAVTFLVWAGWTLARGRAKLLSAALWFLAWLGFALASLGLGLGVSWLASKATGLPWQFTYMPNVPMERPILWVLVLGLTLGGSALVAWRSQTRPEDRSPLLGALAVNLALLAVMAWVLPGGTFLCSLPSLAVLIAVIGSDLFTSPWIARLAVVFTVSLFVPVLHTLFMALTAGALGAVLLLAAFPMALVASLGLVGRGATVPYDEAAVVNERRAMADGKR